MRTYEQGIAEGRAQGEVCGIAKGRRQLAKEIWMKYEIRGLDLIKFIGREMRGETAKAKQ